MHRFKFWEFKMFELHITSTKDIDKIQIDFSDGKSCIASKPDKTDKPCRKEKTFKNSRDSIETYNDEEQSSVIVEKPEVPDAPNKPNVEKYLNGLEF